MFIIIVRNQRPRMAFCAQNVDSIETCEHFLEINDIKYANEFGNEVIKIKNSQYKLCCLHTCEGLLQVRAAPKNTAAKRNAHEHKI